GPLPAALVGRDRRVARNAQRSRAPFAPELQRSREWPGSDTAKLLDHQAFHFDAIAIAAQFYAELVLGAVLQIAVGALYTTAGRTAVRGGVAKAGFQGRRRQRRPEPADLRGRLHSAIRSARARRRRCGLP